MKPRRRWYSNRLSQITVMLAVLTCLNVLSNHLLVTYSDDEESSSLSDINNTLRLPSADNTITKTGSNVSKSLIPLSDHAICRADGSESYVCQGPEYDLFADKLEQFVAFVHGEDNGFRQRFFPEIKAKVRRRILAMQGSSTTWGRRLGTSPESAPTISGDGAAADGRQQWRSPFPANITLLAIGNSHTRQIVQALQCQYPTLRYDDVEGIKGTQSVSRRGTYYFIEFMNHAKVHLVTNNALFYSKHWVRYLEEMIHLKLTDIDAMFLGTINKFQNAMNTTFMEVMMEKTSKLEDADFRTIDPPGLKEIARIYKGPIVAHSLMADWGWGNMHNDIVMDKRMLREKRAEKIYLMNGRKYVPILGECSSDQWQQVGVCEDDPTKHRCIGARGGHPDLLVWDFLEGFYELWAKKGKNRAKTQNAAEPP